ncbi:hypothetical protein ACHWQZ_G010527 [Mnemiopsis leidyi]
MVIFVLGATLLGVVLANGTAGLKSQQGTHLAADAAYCRTVGYEINVYNSYTFEYVGCCPEGTSLMCNPWDLVISGGCCDSSKFDFMDCSWLGLGSCTCYNSKDDTVQGEPRAFEEPVYRV